MMHGKNILILGGVYQALSASHSLYGHYNTFLMTTDPIALRGRFFCEKLKMATSDSEEFVRKFKTILNEFNISVIIPMGDKDAEFISKHKDEIEKETNARCAVPDFDVFSKAYNKSMLMELCAEYNIPHPRTAQIGDNIDELKDFPYPALIKPNHSVGARGITHVNGFDELKEKLQPVVAKYGPCTLQEFVENSEYYFNVMMYRDRHGETKNTVISKIIRFYPLAGGSSSYCYSIENPRLEAICRELLEKLNWEGFADFDVLDAGNDNFKIVEINPRVPASVAIAEHSGVQFPQMIIADLLEEEIPVFNYKTGVSLRFLGLDIAWFVSSGTRFKCRPSWFKFWGKDLFYQEGGAKEFRAFMYSMFIGVSKFFKKKRAQ